MRIARTLAVVKALSLAERAVKSGESAVATLDRITPSIESAADVASKAPALVTSERKEVVSAIEKHLTETLTFLQHERLATVKDVTEQISQERIAALAHLTQERIRGLERSSRHRRRGTNRSP
jgi:flagellar motility protein MotE (MotC chaperone)